MALRASALRVDITPELYLPNSGFSLQGSDGAWEVRHRLFATVIRLEDGPTRVVLVATDLHTGTRLLTQRLAALSAVPEEQLFLVGSHTHSAPGNFYGTAYYDLLASRGAGRNTPYVEWLCARLAAAIAALPPAVEARVAYEREAAAGLVRNRAMASFRRNRQPDGTPWTAAAFAAAVGNPLPVDADGESRAVDPHVHLLWVEGVDGAPIAALASFGAHNTASGHRHRAVSADVFGVAARHARDALHAATGALVPVAVVGGSSGDSELVGERPAPKDSWQAVASQGAALGAVLARACLRARGTGRSGPLVVGYRELGLASAPVAAAAATLADEGWVGSGVGGGAYGEAEPPSPQVPPTHPQWPKRQFLIQALIGGLVPVPERAPLRLVDVAGVRLVGLPGEPTNMLAHRVRAAVGGAAGTLVCGYTGDYVGYLTTPEEYERQRYEGMSTLWGRWTGDWVVQELQVLAAGGNTALGVPNLNPHPAALAVQRTQVPAAVPGRTTLTATPRDGGWLLRGKWWVGPGCTQLPPMSGPAAELRFPPTVALQAQPAGGAWANLQLAGEPVNDQTRPFVVWVNRTAGSWEWEWWLPPGVGAVGLTLRFEVGHPGLMPVDPRSNEVCLG